MTDTPTEDLFRDLHRALAEHLTARIKDGDPTGEVLRQAREFLRDNGVTDAGRGETPVTRLDDVLGAMPFKAVQ